jgi:type IV secretory pathway VirJ component
MIAVFTSPWHLVNAADATTIFSKFGSVPLIMPTDTPKGLVVLFAEQPLSNTHNIVNVLVGLDYLVASIHVEKWVAEMGTRSDTECLNIASDITSLTNDIYKRYTNLENLPPILVGIESGAAISYIAAAQSSVNQFHAAVSINFQPTLNHAINLCENLGQIDIKNTQMSTNLRSHKQLNTTWFVFEASNSINSSDDSVKKFIKSIPDARLTVTQNKNLITEKEIQSTEFIELMTWLDPHIEQQLTGENSKEKLPIREILSSDARDDRFVIMISGDGGWAEFDRGVASNYTKRGINVIGFDSLTYFWHKRTPRETADALTEIINDYGKRWHKAHVILFGYSFGADVLPFIVNRLPESIQKRIDRVIVAGLGKRANFEFHFSNWLGGSGKNSLSVIDEIHHMPPVKVVCIAGRSEEGSVCTKITSQNNIMYELPGDHHFDDNYSLLVEKSLNGDGFNK